ncbi:MAG: histidine--tRNA ligase [Dehalococcoidia bacterium]
MLGTVFRAARGTKDIQPQEQKYWRYVEGKAADLGRRHGFKRIDTPTFESSDLFTRSVGEGTDIMDKETYTFLDRGGDSLTLRPEGTAPVCRAYLEHGMHSLPQPVRLYYFCPVFRYDRPQAGRYRQHHQFGVEALGDGDPIVDAEIVQIGWTLMSDLGLKDLSLVLNTIGDLKCRPGYIEELKAYYSGYNNRLCSDCKQRLEHNPLRLLDCKKESCQPLQEEAPASADHLCDECQEHWDQLRHYMKVMNIPYTVDHRLVRGLDYYTRTVFEILPPEEGAQSTLLGGGRYDGLIEQLGGRPTPGVGFATGMERLILNVQRQEVPVPEEEGPRYFIATMEDKGAEVALDLAARIRRTGVGVIQGPRGRSLRGQMRNANSMGVPQVIIIGEDEVAAGTLTLRDMATGDQETVLLEEFVRGLEED